MGKKLKKIINVLLAKTLPAVVNWEFVIKTLANSDYWEFNEILPSSKSKKAEENARKAGKHFTINQEIRDLGHRHEAFLHEFRHALPKNSFPTIIVTRKRIPGAWFSISDYRNIAIVSTWGWEIIDPPPVELFLIREIIGYTLIFSRSNLGTFKYHEITEGCIFDGCKKRVQVRASLWGNLCGDCSMSFVNWNVTRSMQSDALNLLKLSSAIHVENARKESNMPKVFISYARKDRKIAEKTKNVLEDAGCKIWYDQISLRKGDPWKEKIEEAMDECDFVVLLLSNSSLNNKGYFSREVRMALSRQLETPLAGSTAYVLPVKISPCKIPSGIKEIHCIDICTDTDKGLEILADDINAHFNDKNRSKY